MRVSPDAIFYGKLVSQFAMQSLRLVNIMASGDKTMTAETYP
jgi:hypothetical protein